MKEAESMHLPGGAPPFAPSGGAASRHARRLRFLRHPRHPRHFHHPRHPRRPEGLRWAWLGAGLIALTLQGCIPVNPFGWSAEKPTLTTDVEGQGFIRRFPDRFFFDQGQEVTLVARPAQGWVFRRWDGDRQGESERLSLSMEEDTHIIAVFMPEADTIPPSLELVSARAGVDTVSIRFGADEPVRGKVLFGRTEDFELGEQSFDAPAKEHEIVLRDLVPATTYHFRVEAEDGSANASVLEVPPQTTENPVFDLWHGDGAVFGALGAPQRWVNLTGRILPGSGVQSLTFSLNGGPQRDLSVGPNDTRLARSGDFNVELAWKELLAGDNQVALHAEYSSFALDTVMRFRYEPGGPWELPYTVDWGQAEAISDVAQVVDGHWILENGRVRTAGMGYDRLIAIGDTTWTYYEVTVPVTFYAVEEEGHEPPSNGPGVGVIMRWPGHYADGNQPSVRWYPIGTIGLFRWGVRGVQDRAQSVLYGAEGGSLAAIPSFEPVQFGRTYMFRIQVTSGVEGDVYRLKIWPQDGEEPADWLLEGDADARDTGRGSICLMAHHVDAAFGDVNIVPLDPAPPGNTEESADTEEVAGPGDGENDANPENADSEESPAENT